MLADNIPTLCWMANADGYIYWYNRRWHDYCGSTPEQMEGWGWQTVHDPLILPEVLARWTACIAAGEPFEMIFPLRGADEVFHPFLTRIQPMLDSNGNVARWFGANIDITAQIEAETALRAANSQVEAIAAEREAILGQLGEGVIVTDPNGRIIFVNEAATRLHGVSRLDVELDDYSDAYSLSTETGEPHPTETLPLTRAVLHHETIVDARWRIRRPDGSEVLAIGNAKPVHATDGAPIGAVLTIRDDTNRHAGELALADAVAAKEVLLEEVNHRVKNSLQIVTSLLSLQAAKSEMPAVKQSLLEASARIGVVAAMHQSLYATGSHDRVDLSAYLDKLTADTVAALDSKGRISARFSSNGEVVVALDDAVPLALVVHELLTNAIKYAFTKDETGSIEITVRRVGGEILIRLSDDGAGLPHGFNPLKSTGFGMRIVTALTQQLGGRLDLVSQRKGTGFLIALPAPADLRVS